MPAATTSIPPGVITPPGVTAATSLTRAASAVTYTFGKNFDDNAFLVIDGVSVINDTTYYDSVTGSITLSPGLHTVDLRFGQGIGGVGPYTGTYNDYGVSYNTAGNTSTSGTWYQIGANDPNTQFYAAVSGRHRIRRWWSPTAPRWT